MEETNSLTDLARWRRQSLTSIRFYAVMLLVTSLALWGLSRIIHVPRWLAIIVIGVTAFSCICEATNVLYLNAQLRRRLGRSMRQRGRRS
ncbi:MAG: hypothetical protein ACOC95_03645 [Planctomycetota bacterium]